MAVKLYLHIGFPKCGSTTIQEALYINRMSLRQRGYGVCGGDLDLMNASSAARFPVGFFRRQFDAVRAGETVDLEPKFKTLARQAEKAKLKAVVISAENLSASWAASALSCAQEYFECELILYFRRQDDWLVSSWTQWQFKNGESLQSYFDRRMRSGLVGIYQHVLEAYLEHFPRESLSLRFLSRSHLKDGDLVTDFWQAVGLSHTGPGLGLEPVQSKNVSFSVPLATTLKESAYLFRDPHDNVLTSFIDDCHRHRAKAKKGPLTAAQRREIMQRYEAENRWIEDTFFPNGELGDWRALPEVKEEEAATEAPADEPENLRGIAEILSLNLAVLASLREDVDKIKRSMRLK